MQYLCEYKGMQQESVSLQERFERLRIQIDRLKEAATNLQIPWEGEANKHYVLRLQSDFSEAERILRRMESTIQLLAAATEDYQKTEHMIHQLIGGMGL